MTLVNVERYYSIYVYMYFQVQIDIFNLYIRLFDMKQSKNRYSFSLSILIYKYR